jgi:hypothetical protein
LESFAYLITKWLNSVSETALCVTLGTLDPNYAGGAISLNAVRETVGVSMTRLSFLTSYAKQANATPVICGPFSLPDARLRELAKTVSSASQQTSAAFEFSLP